MNKIQINGNDLRAIGFPKNRAIGTAIKIIEQAFRNSDRKTVLEKMKEIVSSPENFLEDAILAPIAKEIIALEQKNENSEIPLKEVGENYTIFGAEHIEPGALNQMDIAMKLPISIAGALMPDAHPGYGLPIGGVLATKDAIIPYGVGVDIGCRMALSIFDIPEAHFLANQAKFKRELIAWTKFGAGAGWQHKLRPDHRILEHSDFNTTPFIKNLHDKAVHQLGTSGGGNHFVEWGIIEFDENDEKLNIPKGKYVALLTHSGSRGFGATIAGHYTKIAKEVCHLPKEAVNLAYLDMNSAEAQEYWIAMNLAGNYACACHEVIHDRMVKAIGGEVLAKVENHHNFAWKETWNGEELIVHRKGATPASKDVMGIIPGSMTAPGFLVRGKGENSALNSASHGAGRQMSRTKAKQAISKNQMTQILKDHGVTLIGAGIDEAPMAYKNIETVMASQQDLVDVIAKFTPKIVRMADDGSIED